MDLCIKLSLFSLFIVSVLVERCRFWLFWWSSLSFFFLCIMWYSRLLYFAIYISLLSTNICCIYLPSIMSFMIMSEELKWYRVSFVGAAFYVDFVVAFLYLWCIMMDIDELIREIFKMHKCSYLDCVDTFGKSHKQKWTLILYSADFSLGVRIFLHAIVVLKPSCFIEAYRFEVILLFMRVMTSVNSLSRWDSNPNNFPG